MATIPIIKFFGFILPGGVTGQGQSDRDHVVFERAFCLAQREMQGSGSFMLMSLVLSLSIFPRYGVLLNSLSELMKSHLTPFSLAPVCFGVLSYPVLLKP